MSPKVKTQLHLKIKRLSILFIILCFVLSTSLLINSGIIPGINADIDHFKQDVKAASRKSETYEGIFLDRYGDAITNPYQPGVDGSCIDDEAFSWIIGFNDPVYGTSGLRQQYQDVLWQPNSTIQLTLDNEAQIFAYEVLKNISHDGSIIILDHTAGEIIALASRGPVDFNINAPLNDFFDHATMEGSQLMRGVTETNPPGSVWKSVTAYSYLASGHDLEPYLDDGTYTTIDGYTIYNAGNAVFGEIGLDEAFCYSSNCYFANMGMNTGVRNLIKSYESFGLGQDIALDFTTLQSYYHLDYSTFSTAQTSFGQGQTQITPLHLAMIFGAFQTGEMKLPYLIKAINDDEVGQTETFLEPFDEDAIYTVNQALHTCANYYGFDEDYGYVIAKTGTAEVQDGVQTYLAASNERYTFLISTADNEASSDLINPMSMLLYKFR